MSARGWWVVQGLSYIAGIVSAFLDAPSGVVLTFLNVLFWASWKLDARREREIEELSSSRNHSPWTR